jgi:glycosyltransferase involved in cell wall biosynthesis
VPPVPLRVLFLNEGALGAGVIGHPRVERSLQHGLENHPEIDARFIRLPPMGRLARAAVRGVPLLGDVDADAQRTRWHLAQAVRARTAVRRELHRGVDAIHVNSHTIALLLGRVMERIPTYISVDATIRAWEHLGAWRPVRPWTDALLAPSYAAERREFARAAAVTPWTHWAADDVRAECPDANLHIIHPGIDLDLFRPGEKGRRVRSRLLFVGGRFHEKGGGLLLDSLADVLGQTVDLDVVTNADVPARPGVTVHRLDAGSPALVRLFQDADLLCLPTKADAAPFVVIEALACGTPVVGTAVGGIPEMVGHGDAGAVVPVGDGRALRQAIDGLLADPARRAEMGAAGRRRCETIYEARTQSQRLVEVMLAGR